MGGLKELKTHKKGTLVAPTLKNSRLGHIHWPRGSAVWLHPCCWLFSFTKREWCEKHAFIYISFIRWQVKYIICLHFISNHSGLDITLYVHFQSPWLSSSEHGVKIMSIHHRLQKTLKPAVLYLREVHSHNILANAPSMFSVQPACSNGPEKHRFFLSSFVHPQFFTFSSYQLSAS